MKPPMTPLGMELREAALRSRPRIIEIARCCGPKFRRWRFADQPFPPGIESCHRCHKPIIWQPIEKKILDPNRRRRRRRSDLPVISAEPAQKLSPTETAWRAYKKSVGLE